MSNSLKINLQNREEIINAVKEEMIGPRLDFSASKHIDLQKDYFPEGPFFWEFGKKKEEVLVDAPSRKYASGMIYPIEDIKQLSEELEDDDLYISEGIENVSNIPSSNRQTNMGISFALNSNVEYFDVDFNCGVYESDIYMNKEYRNLIWKRKSLNYNQRVFMDEGSIINKQIFLIDAEGEINHQLNLRMDINIRDFTLKGNSKIKLVTISITNMTKFDTSNPSEEVIAFQTEIKASVEDFYTFASYPKASDFDANISEEDKKFEMLYLSEKNYAFGQNCSVFWEYQNENIRTIKSTYLPSYETKTVTPNISYKGENISLSHLELAAARNSKELIKILSPIVEGYKEWITKLEVSSNLISNYYKKVVENSISDAKLCLNRIEKGIKFLIADEITFNAFKVSNLAMLMQMVNGKEKRSYNFDSELNLIFEEEFINIFEDIDFKNWEKFSLSLNSMLTDINQGKDSPLKKYRWRGFQIAFLLMNIESIANKCSEDREIVDLIWFPTGGGKTEAYLALAAFSMIHRRLTDKEDSGTDIIMRYTLRLLTADQFQRCTRLICSLEYIRRRMSNYLGEVEYSIGLWVGSKNTPNSNSKAIKTYQDIILKKENTQFILNSCPWCGAELIPVKTKTGEMLYKGFSATTELHAYCPDKKCEFHNVLPIYFVDQKLYEIAPTFIIGTVDKFVRLTWEPKARAFFGIDREGNRVVSPPNLIIQDELHLISGPLGTLMGIYECLIDELTTDYRDNNNIKSKIICATATIKGYENQIKSVFGRNKSKLFPPSGLDINDNFFSTVSKDDNNDFSPGRKYVGIYATTQGKLQTRVQVVSSVLAKTGTFRDDEKDPWWTILGFFNSLKDIGTSLTLTNEDIPRNLLNYYRKNNISEKNRRYLDSSKVKELTSRLDHGRISQSLDELKIEYKSKNNQSLDLCLASNIIEVGVDVDRLSLMTVNGQPMSTAQYIQVTGRVGRRVEDRPGLVLTIYNPNSNNDKSRYEHFIEYHQKLYGHVEDTSVTPFSRFAISKGLPAIIIGYLRQNFDIETLGTKPDYDEFFKKSEYFISFINRVKNRMMEIDSTEEEYFKKVVNEFPHDIYDKNYDAWEFKVKPDKSIVNGYMVPMQKDKEDIADNVIMIINSLRSVDAQSKLAVTRLDRSDDDNTPDKLNFFS